MMDYKESFLFTFLLFLVLSVMFLSNQILLDLTLRIFNDAFRPTIQRRRAHTITKIIFVVCLLANLVGYAQIFNPTIIVISLIANFYLLYPQIKQKKIKILILVKAPIDLSECSICFEDVKMKGVKLECPCNIAYHKKCISSWIHQSQTCPMCRMAIK